MDNIIEETQKVGRSLKSLSDKNKVTTKELTNAAKPLDDIAAKIKVMLANG